MDASSNRAHWTCKTCGWTNSPDNSECDRCRAIPNRAAEDAYDRACRERDFSGSDNPAAYASRQGQATPKSAVEYDDAVPGAPGWSQPLRHTSPNSVAVQICGYCGRSGTPVWHADDDLYAEATEGIISCPDCFTDVCRRKGIKLVWRPVRAGDSLDEHGDWAW